MPANFNHVLVRVEYSTYLPGVDVFEVGWYEAMLQGLQRLQHVARDGAVSSTLADWLRRFYGNGNGRIPTHNG